MTPFPGTTLYDEGVRDGVLNIDPWIDFMENPTEEFKAQVWDEHFTRDELSGPTSFCLSPILLETDVCGQQSFPDSKRFRSSLVKPKPVYGYW